MSNAKNSQISWVKSQLRDNGIVSRNDALNRRITRLGAIINLINKSPEWEIKGRWTEGQKDYVYEVVRKPIIRKIQIIGGRAVEVNPQVININGLF